MKLRHKVFAIMALCSLFMFTANAQNVAKVGGTEYADLLGAIEAVQDDETVVLLSDVTLDYGAREAFSTAAQTVVTIDGDGKTLTLNQTNSDWSSMGLANGAKLVLNNMKIEKTGYGDTSGAWNTHAIIFSCPLEMTNVTVNNGIAVQAGATLNNVTINEANGYYGLWINGNGQSVTMNGGAINATNGGRGIKVADQYIDAPAQVTLSVTDTKFNTAEKAAVLVTSTAGAKIAASNVDITNVTGDNANFVWVDEDRAANYGAVEVTGATVSQEAAGAFFATVVADGKVKAYYKTLQEAVDAVQNGETITLVNDITENVTLTEKVGLYYTIDGADKTMKGSISVNALSDVNDNRRITIKNIKFVDESAAAVDFITSVNTNHYPRLTVEGCSFTGSGDDSDVAVCLQSSHSVVIKDCTGTGLHSFLQNTSGWNLTVENVTVTGSKGGLALGTVQGVTIKGSKIDVNGYGIRLDADTYNNNAVIESNDVKAFIPVVVRKVNTESNITFNGTNIMNATNTDDLWCAIGKGEYEKNGEMPEAPATGKVRVVLNDTQLSEEGIYGNYVDPIVAKIGEKSYTTFAAALDDVQNDETINLVADDNEVKGNKEQGTEIEFTKAIKFTITGKSKDYALPVVTFQNATVTIKDAIISIPELDARQNATIKVENSTVYDAGGNSIVKSYYNGKIFIGKGSTVYAMQVTTMGYIEVQGTLNATWQTNVYGNGMITVNGEDAAFNTAALHLTGQDYSSRDNTDSDRVGQPAAMIVNGGNFTVGKVFSSSGADYSYNSSKGVNIGTVSGKSAMLNVKNGGQVNIYMADGETAKIGAGGTVNVEGSDLNVICRKGGGSVTLENNGTVDVAGASTLAAATVTGDGWFYMNGVSLDADTKLLGAKVRFAKGENIVDGSTIDDGFFQVGIGAYEGADTNVDTENGVVVTVKNNAKIGSKGNTYAGWVGTGVYETDTEKADAMKDGVKYVLNIENSIAEFGYLHVSNDGELNVNGIPADKAHYNNSDYAFYAGDFIINGAANFTGTDVLALYTKVSCDNGTAVPGTLNINAGTEYEAERHNGAIATSSNFTIYKTGVVNVAENANLQACEASSIAADAALNIAGSVTALGTVTNNGAINLTSKNAVLTTSTTGLAVNTDVADHKINYVDGAYRVEAKDYVAKIGGQGYESLAEALTAAADGATVELLWEEADPAIAMNGAVFGKSVTITGTATVDWNKDFLFVGRGGAGDGTVIFDGANLTSASSSASYGIHVSGREQGTDNKYDGTLVIKNSAIELDYLINRGKIELDEATLTVKNGFGIAGRPATETEDGKAATATITLANNSKLIVDNHNGMGLGQASSSPEGKGVMNVNSGSTFETTQAFLVTANGTMNVNGGTVKIAEGKTLTNSGIVYVTDASNLEATVTGDGWFYMNGVILDADTKLAGAKVGFINGTNEVKGSSIRNGFFSVGIGQNAAAATAAAFAEANNILLNGDVTVNVSDNAVIGGNGETYSGWVGSAYSAEKNQKKYVLNVENSGAAFGYMHVSKDGEINVDGRTIDDNKYKVDNANVDFYAGDFIINGKVTLNDVDAWAKYTKMSVDHADAVLNITGDTKYESSIHNGSTTGTSLLFRESGEVNIAEGTAVEIDNQTTLVEGAEINIGGDVVAKGAVTGNGTINLTAVGATFKVAEGLLVNSTVDDYKASYADGAWTLVTDHYTFVDGEFTEYTNSQDIVAGKLTYKRAFSGVWTPLYVPFEIPVSAFGDDFDVAYINGVRKTDENNDGELDAWDMEVIYIHGGAADGSAKTLKANYPYFVRSRSGETAELNITLEDVTLYAANEKTYDCSTMTEKFEITGSIKQMESSEFEDNDYIVSSDGWQHIEDGSSLKPFRFYMTVTSRDGNAPINTVMNMEIKVRGEEREDGTTFIYDVEQEKGDAAIYDLLGRRVQNPQKGSLYIINGKKVIFQ